MWKTFFGFILQVMLEEGIANSTEPLTALKNPEYLARAAKIQDIGLAPAYKNDNNMHKVCAESFWLFHICQKSTYYTSDV